MKPGALIGFIPGMEGKICKLKNEHGFKENAPEKFFLRGIFFLKGLLFKFFDQIVNALPLFKKFAVFFPTALMFY